MRGVLIFCIAIIINVDCHAQDYPIFTTHSYWQVNFLNPSLDTSQQIFSIPISQSDTIINTHIYKKIFSQIAPYNYSTGIYGPLSSLMYYGAMRNDSIAKKVYYVFYGDSSEYLIYNFNATTGDTLFKIYNPLEYDSCNYLVSSVDTIILCGKQIRHFILNRITTSGLGSNVSWYEGWGGSDGIVTTRSDVNLYCCFSLLCFSSNDTVYNPNACYFGQCQLPTNLENVGIQESELKIYPNPSTGVCNIKATSFRKAYLFVYDMTGRILFQQPFYTETQLNTSSLSQGIYIGEVKDDNGKSVKAKIVKE